jgi:hypothetical protein
MEEQESNQSRKVKTEGDRTESLIKQLIKEIDSEFANMEREVNNCMIYLFSIANNSLTLI